MANEKVTPMFVAKEVGNSFIRAWGKRRPTVYREILTRDLLDLCVDVAPTDDVQEMRRRAVRAGRILADEAMRKRLKSFTRLDLPLGVTDCAAISSKVHGIALRLIRSYVAMWDTDVYRITMRGSRQAR